MKNLFGNFTPHTALEWAKSIMCMISYKQIFLFALFFRCFCYSIPKKKLFSDAYRNIFIDNGGPDSYLSSDINNFLNDSFNGTFNLSSTPISNGTDTNSDEDVTELIIMAVTSVLLGLMILITVIGKLIFAPVFQPFQKLYNSELRM